MQLDRVARVPDPQQRDEEAEGAPGGQPPGPHALSRPIARPAARGDPPRRRYTARVAQRSTVPAHTRRPPRAAPARRPDSTSDEARARVARGALAAGDVVVADAQSAGRGTPRARVGHAARALARGQPAARARRRCARPARLTVLGAVAACRRARAPRRADVAHQVAQRPDARRAASAADCWSSTADTPAGPRLWCFGHRDQPGAAARRPAPGPRRAGRRRGPAGRGARERLLAALLAELDAALDELGTPPTTRAGARVLPPRVADRAARRRCAPAGTSLDARVARRHRATATCCSRTAACWPARPRSCWPWSARAA